MSNLSAAAASAEPPPSPAATGIRFVSSKCAPAAPLAALNSSAALSTRFCPLSSSSAPGSSPSTLKSRLKPVACGSPERLSVREMRPKMVSSSWKPSPRRAVTARPRFSLAWAVSVSTAVVISRFVEHFWPVRLYEPGQLQVTRVRHLEQPGTAVHMYYRLPELAHQ